MTALTIAWAYVAPGTATTQPQQLGQGVPAAGGRPWLEYADPSGAGFSNARLAEAREHAERSGSAAVVAVSGDHVIAAWGEVDRNFMAHSIRKSLAGALYGLAIAEGRLSLDSTLAGLGLEEQPPLTAQEKRARLRDLLAARSGVYHAAAYAASEQDAARPARDSHAPGSFFFYNNWDFNAAETIYERAMGHDVLTGFGNRIAKPLGMQDYDPAKGLEVLEPSHSLMPAHTFRISARDLARFGLLYLRGGRWEGRQVVPESWIKESFTSRSDLGKGAGYGYLWWIYRAGSLGDAYPALNRLDVYLARGSGGHALFVIPGADMAIVHRADTDNGRNVGGGAIWSLVERLVAAREGSPVDAPRLRPMAASPFANQLPEPAPPRIIKLDAAALQRHAGEYEMDGTTIRVFLHAGRLFINVPGQGEGELFALSAVEFTLLSTPGVKVTFRQDESGRTTGLAAIVGRSRLEARRRR